jgi:hypothetical protein
MSSWLRTSGTQLYLPRNGGDRTPTVYAFGESANVARPVITDGKVKSQRISTRKC